MVVSVALVGLPGSGKSTIGRYLAKRLRIPFIDSDQFIEHRLGCSIREYFEREGEGPFRRIEEMVIEELSLTPPFVLSTGGGSVLSPKNRQHLNSRCRVIYLRSSPEEVFRRLRNDRSRPLLQVADPLQRLRDLFANRDPFYREVSHLVVDVGRPSVSAVVNTIAMWLESSGQLGAAEAVGDD